MPRTESYIFPMGNCIEGAERYVFLERVGKGAFGTVFAASDSVACRVVAVKRVRDRATGLVEVQNQQTLTRLDVPNVARMLDWWEDTAVYIVMPLYGDDLYHSVLEDGPLAPADVITAATGMLCALAVMHAAGLIHGDLKPENVVWHDWRRQAVVLIDFNLMCAAPVQGLLQTRYYRAPEVVLRLPIYPPADMWSVGCVVAELFGGRPLFEAPDERALHALHKAFGAFCPSMLDHSRQSARFFAAVPPAAAAPTLGAVHPDLIPLVAACLVVSPGCRATAQACRAMLPPHI